MTDKTAVLSLLNCAQTHSLAKMVSQHDTLHIAIFDLGCQRLEQDTSMMLPVVGPGNSVVQLLSDLRYLYDFKCIVLDLIVMNTE